MCNLGIAKVTPASALMKSKGIAIAVACDDEIIGKIYLHTEKYLDGLRQTPVERIMKILVVKGVFKEAGQSK